MTHGLIKAAGWPVGPLGSVAALHRATSAVVPLRAYERNPVWTADPNHAAFAKASETLRPNGYAGPLGPASAAVMAEFVMVDMVAEAATGQRSPEEAAQRAEERAKRHYRA